RLRSLATYAHLPQQVFAEAVRRDDVCLAEVEAQRRTLEKDLACWHAQLRAQAGACCGEGADGAALGFTADLQARIGSAEQQLVRLKEQMQALRRRRLNEDEVAVALGQFGPAWESLTPREQARLVQRLVEKVEHDGQAGTVAITFHAAGIKALADEILAPQQETLSREQRA